MNVSWRSPAGPTLFTPGGSFRLTQDRADLRVHTVMLGALSTLNHGTET
jgi:hypothetical protein